MFNVFFAAAVYWWFKLKKMCLYICEEVYIWMTENIYVWYKKMDCVQCCVLCVVCKMCILLLTQGRVDDQTPLKRAVAVVGWWLGYVALRADILLLLHFTCKFLWSFAREFHGGHRGKTGGGGGRGI